MAQRRRRWPINKPTLDQRRVYVGYIMCLHNVYLIPYVQNNKFMVEMKKMYRMSR